jgi:stage II sporulation protein D
MLRRSVLIALVVGLAAGVAASGSGAGSRAVLAGTPSFVISGHGWGHGVGMSQYGAYGYAQHGVGYGRILSHYYPGTQLGRAPIARVRVLLGSAASVTVSSAGAVKLTDANGATGTLEPGTWKLGAGLKLQLPDTARPQQLVAPVTLAPTTAPLRYQRPYRGSLVLTSDGKRVTVVNNVGLEQYLYGVVPSEMPHDWHPEALKAQAVVARSYALAVRRTGGTFDLYPDTRSQVYRGVEGEWPESNAAIDATAGEVLLYQGKVAVTYFYSTSGGRTAAISDVWNSQPVPYLVSVADPYDSISPHHDWGPLDYTATGLGARLKVPGRLVDIRTNVNSSLRATSITAVGTAGQVTVPAADVREILGLRSTWFRVGVLSLDPFPAAAVPYGQSATLTGLGRHLGAVRLEQRLVGAGVWRAVGSVKPKTGRIAVGVKAAAPTQFRFAAGPVTTPPITLRVAPTVRLQVPTGPTALDGRVRPVISKAPVAIQRTRGNGVWATVARTTVDDRGTFAANLAVTPGIYRARVAPGRGWGTAVSAELQVLEP